MKIKESKELKKLSESLKLTEGENSEIIINKGFEVELFVDSPECWDVSIIEHCVSSENHSSDLFKRCFDVYPSSTQWAWFRSLKTIGDGDCPECGGNLEIVDHNYKMVRRDWDSEPEYETISKDEECTNCGKRVFTGIDD